MKKFLLGLLYAVFLAIFLTVLFSCSSVKESTKTEIKIVEKIDTIYVEIPERTDTVKAEPKNLNGLGLVWEGNITKENKMTGKIDTIFQVKFLPQDTEFVFIQKKDSIPVEHKWKDTTTIVNTTTVTEEKSFLEKWWWFILIVLGLVAFIVWKLK